MIDDELLRLVGEHLGSPVTFTSPPTRISGGFWASIHGFTVDGGPPDWQRPLVLRVMPDRTAGERETVVQRTVAEQGFPTPPVLAAGFDEGIGGAYMIMPRADGSSPMAGLDLGRELLHLPRMLRALPIQLADVAVALHALDPAPVIAALAALAAETTDDVSGLELEGGHGVTRRLRSIREMGAADASFTRLADWLDEHQPTSVPAKRVVSHGDIHPFNLLVDAAGDVTVLDWTNANVMPREFDVGFTAGLLRCAPISVPGPLRPALRRVTDRLARNFVDHYAAAAPLDHTAVAWFEALQYGRCLAEVAAARTVGSAIVDAQHPFETAKAGMIRRLAALTEVVVNLPSRRPAPAG